MKKLYLACLSALMTFGAMAQDSQNWLTVTRVISNGDFGSQYYRIPALETCADGSLIAIFDQRGSSQDDLPNKISVVAKRSTDNGATWSDNLIVLAQTNNSNKTYGDPLVIRDRNSGTLICLFVGDTGFYTSTVKGQNVPTIYMTRSYDNGETWEALTSLNEQVFKEEWWAAFAASGKMCQLADGTICALVNARMENNGYAAKINEYVIYTNDCGNTWHTRPGNAVTGSFNGNEAKLVELYDGQLLMSLRAPGHRVFNKSTDAGETWSPAGYSVQELVEPGCNGDIIRYEVGGRKLLLQSIPYNASSRRNVSVFVSSDNGKTWPIRRTLIEGPSCYSSLTVLQDGTIGCLVEEGGNPDDGTNGIRLDFYRFSINWLLEGDADDDSDPRAAGMLKLDGSRYMSIAKNDAFNFSTSNPVTVSLKVRTSQNVNSDLPRLICNRRWEGTNNIYVSGFDMYMGSTNKFANNVNPYTGTRWYCLGHPYSNSTYTSGEWAHYCWTYDGTTSKLYVDGVLQDTKTNENPSAYPINCLGDILVGAGYTIVNGSQSVVNSSWRLNGDIDDVRFYNEALSAADVAADKDAAAPLSGKTLIAAYDFSNISGNTVPDISGNGHEGTLVGFPEPSAETGYIMTLTQNFETMGSYTVTSSDGTEISSGGYATMGDVITVNCTPNQYYHVKDIWVNAERQTLEGNGTTFTVEGHSTVYVEFERDDDAPADYCMVSGNLSGSGRFTRTLNVSDGTTSIDVTPCQDGANGAAYVDKTSTVFNTTAGSEVTVKITSGFGHWLTHYVYVDYNNDGVFTPVCASTAPFTPEDGSELVSYDYWRGPNASATVGYDSKGVQKNSGNVNAGNENISTPIVLPSFIVPATLPTGTYRVRFVRAYNTIDPCLNGYSVTSNGGAIIDFSMYVTGTVTGIEGVEADDADAPAVYYNLQGVKVSGDNLAPGIYIRRQGSKATKVFVGNK